MTSSNWENRAAFLRAWLSHHALPLWCNAGFEPDGFFAERLTLDGAPDVAPKRVFVQMRQIYVYAHAALLGLAPDGISLARNVFERVTERAQLPGGGYAFSLAPVQGIADATRDTYTHAFLLFAASWLYRAAPDREILRRMEKITGAIETLRHPSGSGYAESDKPGPLRRQNPHMHLLEAFLAAYTATGDQRYMRNAGEIYDLFRTRFYDAVHGVLREHYTQGLETDTVHGGVVEGGHHYEWVRLLGEFARASGSTIPPEAQSLYRFAANHAHEKMTDLVYRENRVEGQIHNAGKRAWAMGEAIKAAVTMAEHGQEPLDPRTDGYIDALFQYFLDQPFKGAWLDTLAPNNQPAVTTSAASNFYHMFTAFTDYIRFSDQHPRNR